MKNLLFLFSFVLLLASCGKEQLNETKQQEILSFSKSMTLEDNEGNSVDLTIFANTQTALDDHTSEVLHLVVNKRQGEVATVGNSELTSEENQDNDEMQDDFVYIKVNDFEFSDDVKGFSIKSDLEYFGQQSIDRYSESFYFYAFGADGVDGARVQYTDETRSKEYLTTKFSKKTSSSNWFWQTIATGTLYNVGDVWEHCGSTNWEEFRLKVKVHKAKGGVCCYRFDWEFLINC